VHDNTAQTFIEVLIRNLFVLKQELRQTEGLIKDALLTAAEPNTEYPPEEYKRLADELRQEADSLRQDIQNLETQLQQAQALTNPE